MYTANKRQRKYKTLLRFSLFAIPLIIGIGVAVWFVFFRNPDDSSTNFARSGAEVAVVKPAQQDFTNELFKVTLPVGWASDGLKNPIAPEVFYEYQSKVKDYENRYMRIYVDSIPKDYALNRLMPITVVDNRMIPGVLSDDCTTFTGAPLSGTGAARQSNVWTAKWQGVDFVCDMARPQNYSGTASADEGYAVTLVSKNGTKHKYFLVYIDQNIRPDYSILTEAIKSLQTL
jgi:hypothetical protein